MNDDKAVKKTGEPVFNAIKPTYYNDTKFSPWEVIEDWKLGFNLGSCMKYIKRAGKKDNNSRLQDLNKIKAYVEREIMLAEQEMENIK